MRQSLLICILLCSYLSLWGQNSNRIIVDGIIFSNENDVEAITIFNVSSNKGTITDDNGEFVIAVALNDTLEFSSLIYKPIIVMVDEHLILTKHLVVLMEEKINQLNEVVVGEILTGDLLLDIKNRKGNPSINFYDLGIPGYTGKKATQNERRLYAANGDGLNYKTLILQLLTANLAIDPIVNGISGRTKMLKSRIKLDENDNLLRYIKARVSEDFFSMQELDDTLHTDFLYFCQEDESFNSRCKGKSDFEILEFLNEKFIEYKINLNLNKD